MSDTLAVELILRGRAVESELDALLAAATPPGGMKILVNNEVGFEIVSVNALARALRDMAGTIN